MPAITTQGYNLIAKALGRAQEYLISNGDALSTFRLTVEAIMLELEADNPRFDRTTFLQAITAAANECEAEA
jgi:hypothetical protein